MKLKNFLDKIKSLSKDKLINNRNRKFFKENIEENILNLINNEENKVYSYKYQTINLFQDVWRGFFIFINFSTGEVYLTSKTKDNWDKEKDYVDLTDVEKCEKNKIYKYIYEIINNYINNKKGNL